MKIDTHILDQNERLTSGAFARGVSLNLLQTCFFQPKSMCLWPVLQTLERITFSEEPHFKSTAMYLLQVSQNVVGLMPFKQIGLVLFASWCRTKFLKKTFGIPSKIRLIYDQGCFYQLGHVM